MGAVFSKLNYFLLGLVVSTFFFITIALLPHLSLITKVLGVGASASKFFLFLFSLIGGFLVIHPLEILLTIFLISLLFGLNFSMTIYLIRQRRIPRKNSSAGLSLGALVATLFGISCAACGSIIATSIASLLGSGAITYLLPFGGKEMLFIAILLLLFSIKIVNKKINDPLVCESC